jgi:hypothetical protein
MLRNREQLPFLRPRRDGDCGILVAAVCQIRAIVRERCGAYGLVAAMQCASPIDGFDGDCPARGVDAVRAARCGEPTGLSEGPVNSELLRVVK